MHEIDKELEKFTLPEPSIPMVNINTGLEYNEFYSSACRTLLQET
jgi:hypothetical protein